MIQIVPSPISKGCKLTYSFDTYPTPLQVSPAGGKKVQHGIIKMVVSNTSTDPVRCEQIKLILPIGGGPSHLTETPDTIAADVYTNVDTKGWEVHVDKNGVVVATPGGESAVEITRSDSVVLCIYYIQVNKKTGTFTLSVEETISKSNDAMVHGTYKQSFCKFPHGFFLNDFAAYKDISQNEGQRRPITVVDNSGDGEKVTLAWRGASDVRYTIRYFKSEEPDKEKVVDIDEGGCTWTSDCSIGDTTTFRLVATAGGGEYMVSAYLCTTVGVKWPDIKAKSLEVADKLVLGEVKVGGGGHLVLKEGRNNDPTIGDSVGKKWLRIVANNVIGFWTKGGAFKDDSPQMKLGSEGELSVSGDINAAKKLKEAGAELIPKGSIIMWYGDSKNVPEGWALCDGEEGRPDLVGRFPMGGGWTYEGKALHLGDKGGSDGFQLTGKELPSHDHIGSLCDDSIVGAGIQTKLSFRTVDSFVEDGNGHINWRTIMTDKPVTTYSARGNYVIRTELSGEGRYMGFLPRYCVVNYIIKL